MDLDAGCRGAWSNQESSDKAVDDELLDAARRGDVAHVQVLTQVSLEESCVKTHNLKRKRMKNLSLPLTHTSHAHTICCVAGGSI